MNGGEQVEAAENEAEVTGRHVGSYRCHFEHVFATIIIYLADWGRSRPKVYNSRTFDGS